jgi:hypothetical protein
MALALYFLLGLSCAIAAPPVTTPPALGGYDVVAYWSLPSDSPAVLGSSKFTAMYTAKDRANETNAWSYDFFFVSAANRDCFIANPTKYLPQWGGFCAYGIASEKDGWPWARDYLGPPGGANQSWFIYESKLYMTFMPSMRAGWIADGTKNVASGDARWIDWFGALDRGPVNVNCTAAHWWGNTCSFSPQVSDGIPPAHPVPDACIATLDQSCKSVREGVQGGPPACVTCLHNHLAQIITSGTCPAGSDDDDETPGISPLAVHVYCM